MIYGTYNFIYIYRYIYRYRLRINHYNFGGVPYSQTHPSIAKNKMNTELFHTLPMSCTYQRVTWPGCWVYAWNKQRRTLEMASRCGNH